MQKIPVDSASLAKFVSLAKKKSYNLFHATHSTIEACDMGQEDKLAQVDAKMSLKVYWVRIQQRWAKHERGVKKQSM